MMVNKVATKGILLVAVAGAWEQFWFLVAAKTFLPGSELSRLKFLHKKHTQLHPNTQNMPTAHQTCT